MADKDIEFVVERSPLDETVEVYKRKSEVVDCFSQGFKPKRVAAYCRISKNVELMQTSLKTQMEAFQKYISERPEWQLVDIYYDRGISGLSTRKRSGFQRMIDDCQAGKIDIILAKSVSRFRFARNTVDTLKYVRLLRDMGVTIRFDKEKIDTADLIGEMLLSVYAAFAQEESLSISENVKRGFRQRFLTGTAKYFKVYGYYPDPEDKTKWHIKEDEAKVIREIYSKFISGVSVGQMRKEFMERNIPAPECGKWYASSIFVMLKNERYVGDFLMQKTVMVDVFNHVSKPNNGIAPMYLKKDHHPPIVSREDFELVQRMMVLRYNEVGYHQYPYYDYMRCPKCGKQMVQFLNLHPRYPACWICSDHKNCTSLYVMNRYVDDAVRKAIETMDNSDSGNDGFVKEAKRHLSNGGAVELVHLRKLIGKIDIIDNYTALKITYAKGGEYVYRIRFVRPTDHPDPKVENIGGLVYINGIHYLNKIDVKICKAIKEIRRFCKEIEINSPQDESDVFRVKTDRRAWIKQAKEDKDEDNGHKA